jgi:hypothetical protein
MKFELCGSRADDAVHVQAKKSSSMTAHPVRPPANLSRVIDEEIGEPAAAKTTGSPDF